MRDGRLAVIAAWIVLLTLALECRGWSTDLTGILLYGLDVSGNPAGPFWHTASTPKGRPLGVVENWFPTQLRGAGLANGTNGEIDIGISSLPFAHVIAVSWQYAPGEFPPRMAMNLYFNGDNLAPGISVVVPAWFGLTQFAENTAPSTFTLYLGEVDNQGSRSFDDGALQVRLTAAWYLPSGEPTYQWRPTDFVYIDRVGVRDFQPDGRFDGVLIFELTIGPTARPPTPAVGNRPQPAGDAAEPPVAIVGGDQWIAPETPALPLEPPTPPSTTFAPSVVGEPPTPAASAAETPSPAVPVATSLTAAVTVAARASATPAADASRSPTLGAGSMTPVTTPRPRGDVRESPTAAPAR